SSSPSLIFFHTLSAYERVKNQFQTVDSFITLFYSNMSAKSKSIVLSKSNKSVKQQSSVKNAATSTVVDEKQISKTASTSKLEIVIAHFEENLSWIQPMDWKIVECVYIYHKGDPVKKAKDYSFPS